MEETPSSPSPRPAPTWSITKAEWDGFQTATPLNRILNHAFATVVFVCGLGLLLMPVILEKASGVSVDFGWTAVAGPCVMASSAFIYVFSRWWERRWNRLRVFIWDANGCVCPWCHVRTDATPCQRHGLSSAEHQIMLDYWQALPALALGDRAKALLALRDAARRRPFLWRVLGIFERARLRSEAVQHDPDSTLGQRLRGAVPSAIVMAVMIVLLLALLIAFAPSAVVRGFVPVALPWLLVSPFMVAIGPLWRSGKPRCTACKHICHAAKPSICTECGVDLTRPGAVTRIERSNRVPALLAFLPLTVLLGVMFFKDEIVGVLPKPVRNAYWSNIRPPNAYWLNLAPATMTQAEVDEAADLLIACARPDGPRPVFGSSFLCDAERAGKLTSQIVEQVARTTVQATLDVTQDGGALVATVSPKFGELLLGPMRTPRIVFGGVSIDGGKWTSGADWSLFEHDVDDFWRNNGQLPALPESQLVFTGRIDDAPKGTRTVRARCWIVIHGARWERLAPAFDETGVFVPPAGAVVFPLDLEATVEVR